MSRRLAGSIEAPGLRCGTLGYPIYVMCSAYDTSSDHLAQRRTATIHHAAPENNLLFSRVLAAEGASAGGVS
ncbi:MAG: hypothetical protein AB7R77_22150 [Ilumatobacteraceae bacterium]